MPLGGTLLLIRMPVISTASRLSRYWIFELALLSLDLAWFPIIDWHPFHQDPYTVGGLIFISFNFTELF